MAAYGTKTVAVDERRRGKKGMVKQLSNGIHGVWDLVASGRKSQKN